jgi:hypothetical protein
VLGGGKPCGSGWTWRPGAAAVGAAGRGRRRLYLDLERLETRLAQTVTLSVIDPQSFPEGDSGNTDMLFTVTRSGDPAPAVQVNYATQVGTVQVGTDYVATAGTLRVGSGETTKTIAVPIKGSTLLQSDRTFTVALSNPLSSTTFAAQQIFATGTNPIETPYSVALADINDGHPSRLTSGLGQRGA